MIMHEHLPARNAGLPGAFCWTRFGTEAGEPIERILERKENERLANGGVFYWGIGNSVAPGIAELVRQCGSPEVLFSPIKGRPRDVDVTPPSVVMWTRAEALSGETFDLPQTVRVTSRSSHRAPAAAHYALVCRSEQPLEMSDLGRLRFRGLRNLLSGRAIGPSQVTAVVRPVDEPLAAGLEYTVAFRTSLVPPYFVRLRGPVELSDDGRRQRLPQTSPALQLQF
jgi:hypothetical protein